MQACSLDHGVAVLAAHRAALLLDVGDRLQTIWLAAPPRRFATGHLRRGLWLQWRALAWSAALRSGRQTPGAVQHAIAAVRVVSPWCWFFGVGVAIWGLSGTLLLPPAILSWVFPPAIAAARLIAGRGRQQQRDWHAIEHRALDRVLPSRCGRPAMVAATLAACAGGWLAWGLASSPWPPAIVDLVVVIGMAALSPWTSRLQRSRGRHLQCGSPRGDGARERAQLAALQQMVAQLLATNGPDFGRCGASPGDRGVASDLSAVYTVAPEGRGTTSST